MRIFLLAILLAVSVTGFSQNIKLEGVIKDSTGTALEMANIMAVNKATNAMDAYAITNEAGRYQLSLKANTEYTLKATFIGFTPMEMPLTTGATDIVKNITLQQGIELQELEIVHEMPVTVKGDTIVYNSDSFTNGSERKLEDVLKKLPGVEVNSDGEVKVEGKTVSKLMVEGKDFFDGDTKLGVKNIPADALDKIEVLRNYNEVSQLKGLENNEENVAMNIKLKSGKKNFWFGDLTAGGGFGDGGRYIANPKVFYYNPKYSLNLINNFNNNGELPLTIQDYFKFTGGFRSMMRKGGTSFNVSSNDLGISLLRNNRAKEIETKFGAANFSYNPKDSWTISGFAILNSSRNELQTNSRRQVLDPQTLQPQTTQETTETSEQKSDFGLFKLSSSYKPNKNVHFDYDALAKISNQEEVTGLLSSVYPETSQSQDIYTSKKQKPFSVNQNLNYYYTLNDKNVFAFEAQHLYQQEDPFYTASLQNNPFPGGFGSDPSLSLSLYPVTGRYNLKQDRFVTTNKLDVKADYYYMVTPKSNINITLGNTYSYQNFNSGIFQILDDGTQTGLNDETKNKVNYTFNDAFIGLHYKFITGKFTFNPGVSFHSYTSFNEQLGTKVHNNFYRLLPDIYALYQMKKAERLVYNYSMTTNFTDVANFAQGLILNSYNSLFRGNRNLENALYQTHSLSYSRYDMFNFTQIFGSVNYSYREDAVKNIAGFTGINQVSTVVNSNFADKVLSGNAGYTRSFLRYYKFSGNVALSWSKFNNFRFDTANAGQVPSLDNSERQVSEQFTQNYKGSFSTSYANIPNLEVGYSLNVNDYAGSKFYTHQPYAKFDYYFWEALTVTAEYEYNHYYNSAKTSDNEYDFLSASIMYRKKDSKWEFRVGGTNLLNTTSLNDDSFNQFSTRTSRYVVQPRYLLFTVRYSL